MVVCWIKIYLLKNLMVQKQERHRLFDSASLL